MVLLLMRFAPALDWAASAAMDGIAKLAAATAVPSNMPRRISLTAGIAGSREKRRSRRTAVRSLKLGGGGCERNLCYARRQSGRRLWRSDGERRLPSVN